MFSRMDLITFCAWQIGHRENPHVSDNDHEADDRPEQEDTDTLCGGGVHKMCLLLCMG